MADLHKLFQKFHNEVILTAAKQEDLRRSRDALRSKIKKWFLNHEKLQPSFCWQGSFAMKTVINPLPDGEYDLDDGIYLNGYDGIPKEDWIATSTCHNWIVDATKGHTTVPPVNKDTCVRVIYQKSYHIDYPIYIMKDGIAHLAHKTNGWIESDPKAFKAWFLDKNAYYGEQLRTIVKYLKAWKDYKEIPLKGIEITILAAEHFDAYEGRDDKCLKNVVDNIINTLEASFVCRKPVMPFENLFDDFSDTKKNTILSALKALKSKIEKAIDEEDEEKASQYMIEMFGSRFPKGSPTPPQNSKLVKTEAPGVLKHDGRSA